MVNLLLLSQLKLGAQRIIHSGVFYEALNLLNKDEVNLIVFCSFTKNSKLIKWKQSNRFIVYAYPFSIQFRNLLIDIFKLIFLLPKLILFLKQVIKKYNINHIRVDGVTIWGVVGFLLKKIYGINFSIFIPGNEVEVILRKYKLKCRKIVEFLMFSIYKLVLSNATNVATNLITIYNNLRRFNPRVYFLPTYVDISRYRCEREILSEKPVKFMYVGRFDREKGIDVLLSALRVLLEKKKEFEFLFIGHGMFGECIKKLASQSNGKIKFIGEIDNIEMPKWYNRVDVVVLPSYTEGMPAVLMEAMACKRLVIATSVGSIPFLLDNGKCGLLIKPGDRNELIRKLISIIDNPDKRKLRTMASRGKKRIRIFVKLYEKIAVRHFLNK